MDVEVQQEQQIIIQFLVTLKYIRCKN